MDGLKSRLTEWFGRYKYVFLVVMAGVLLMLLPGKETVDQPEPAELVQTPAMDARLEQVLAQIRGVGKVQVLLTVSQGARTIYVFDEDENESADSSSMRREVVILTDENRTQSGLIYQVLSPVYQGAVIVCQGGDEPAVRLAVVEAVSDATGLSADKITVLKMK